MADITGKKPLEFGAQTIADLKTVLGIADEGNANDYFYLKTEVDALITEARTPKLLRDLKAIGSDVLSVPYGATTFGKTGSALTSGKYHAMLHIVEKTITVTGVEYGQTAAASFTGNNFNGFDLCSVDKATGVMTQIAKTENNAAIFTGTGYLKKAFLAPVELTPGLYVVRVLWSSSATTTAPSLMLCATADQSDYSTILGTAIRTEFSRSSQTDLTTGESMSSGVGSSVMYALHLY